MEERGRQEDLVTGDKQRLYNQAILRNLLTENINHLAILVI